MKKDSFNSNRRYLEDIMENMAGELTDIQVLLGTIKEKVEMTSSDSLCGPFDPWDSLQDWLVTMLQLAHRNISHVSTTLTDVAEKSRSETVGQ